MPTSIHQQFGDRAATFASVCLGPHSAESQQCTPGMTSHTHRLASASAMHCLQRETRPLAVSVLRWNWEESFSILHLVQTCR